MQSEAVEKGKQTVSVGEVVWIYDINARRQEGPRQATVVKVGRKLCTLRYEPGSYTQVFRLTGKANDDYGHQWFKTEAQRAVDDRRNAAIAALHGYGLEFRMGRGRDMPTETIEAIVRAIDGGDGSTPKTSDDGCACSASRNARTRGA